MMKPVPFFDPHVHADSRSAEDYPRLLSAGCRGLVAVAGPGGGYRSADSVLDHFRRLQRIDRPRVERSGLRCWLALGIHPAGVPESGLDELLRLLPAELRQADAVAIGEIGLQDTGPTQERLLRAQLDLAAEMGLSAIVHTPRREKRVVVERILEILRASDLPPGRVLLDHLDRSTLEMARPAGVWLGLSVHPAKLSPEDAASVVSEYGPERLILSSDMGANPSILFALPAAISAMRSRGLSEQDIGRVVYHNALNCLGIRF